MKKLALVLALTLAALAGSAFASDWNTDNVGIYTDEAGTTNCITMVPYTPTTAYLVLTQLNASDINAWELALTYTNVTSLSFAPRGYGAIDVALAAGEHIVGMAQALPVVGGTVVIADMQLMVTNTDAAAIKAGGTFFHTLPLKVPAYQGTQTEVRELHPISVSGQPVMTINDGCVVATETSSFGSVKGLFR